jgi:hypothetical protein
MGIQVRYIQAGRQVESQTATTMFEARKLAGKGALCQADTVQILAVRDDGQEREIETRLL